VPAELAWKRSVPPLHLCGGQCGRDPGKRAIDDPCAAAEQVADFVDLIVDRIVDRQRRGAVQRFCVVDLQRMQQRDLARGIRQSRRHEFKRVCSRGIERAGREVEGQLHHLAARRPTWSVQAAWPLTRNLQRVIGRGAVGIGRETPEIHRQRGGVCCRAFRCGRARNCWSVLSVRYWGREPRRGNLYGRKLVLKSKVDVVIVCPSPSRLPTCSPAG